MSWLVMVLTSLIIVRTSIADAANEVYADRTEVVEGILVRENILMRKICMETNGSGIKEAWSVLTTLGRGLLYKTKRGSVSST